MVSLNDLFPFLTRREPWPLGQLEQLQDLWVYRIYEARLGGRKTSAKQLYLSEPGALCQFGLYLFNSLIFSMVFNIILGTTNISLITHVTL